MRQLVITLTTIGALAAMFATTSTPSLSADKPKPAIATFAGGCFWCVESDFDKVPGVLKTISGYMGGHTARPTYKQVTRGTTGHTEVVQITYDPSKTSYVKLLHTFWRSIDPFDLKGQFCDKGSQYRPEVFYHTESQRQQAEASRTTLNASGRFNKKIAVPITKASTFTEAEGYHQDYYKKNPLHYWSYRRGCRRDDRVRAIWGNQKTH